VLLELHRIAASQNCHSCQFANKRTERGYYSCPWSTNNSSINCHLWICYDPKWSTHRVPVVSVQTLIDGTQFFIGQHDRAYSSKGIKAIFELGFQMSTNMERTFISHDMYKLTTPVNVVYCIVHTQGTPCPTQLG